MIKMLERVLVIKHGALGDWILATGAFKLIRAHHSTAEITLLTNTGYGTLAKDCTWFDQIQFDDRKGVINTFKVIRKLQKKAFHVVYDLQRSQRTSIYYRWLKNSKLYWSGKVKGCEGYFIDIPDAHVLERMVLQLKASQIYAFPTPDVAWLKTDIQRIKPQKRYALIIPGAAKHRPQKRWTVSGYVTCVQWLASQDIVSILIGTVQEREMIQMIIQQSGTEMVSSLYSRPFSELLELARHATIVLGSDTGPMHLAALSDTPCLVFFCSRESSVTKSKPWGKEVMTIHTSSLTELCADTVIASIEAVISREPV